MQRNLHECLYCYFFQVYSCLGKGECYVTTMMDVGILDLGGQWLPMADIGCQWLPMVVNGFANGCQWFCQWLPMATIVRHWICKVM
jgi:hypothetical protein